jgi:hypothetical protein
LAARIEALERSRNSARLSIKRVLAYEVHLSDEGARSLIEAVAALSGATEPADPEPEYPHESGDFIVLGPEAFADKKRTVICWRGENYRRVRGPGDHTMTAVFTVEVYDVAAGGEVVLSDADRVLSARNYTTSRTSFQKRRVEIIVARFVAEAADPETTP